jgi:cytochrome b involved in lipid metabolism
MPPSSRIIQLSHNHQSSGESDAQHKEKVVVEIKDSDQLPESPKRTNSLPGLIPICSTCDACPFCLDVCANPDCTKCARKNKFHNEKRSQDITPTVETSPNMVSAFCRFKGNQKVDHEERFITPCQLKRHNRLDSAWLVCGSDIYDATNYIRGHPGGEKSILKKSGGAADCSKDMKFHSARAIKMWKQNRVGTLRPCPGENGFFSSDEVSTENAESCVIS